MMVEGAAYRFGRIVTARHRPMVAILALLAVMLGMVSAAMAQDVELSEKRQQLVDQLGHESYAKRQAATRTLMRGPSLSDAQLRAMLERAASAEQHHRLLQVAKHQTIRSFRRNNFDRPQKGALGIRHHARPAMARPEGEGAAVVVVETIVGFPGHSHFEPGDQIIAINGQPVPDNADDEHLPRRITQFRKGEKLRLTLLRRGERRRMELTLAGSDALGAATQQRRVGAIPGLSELFIRAWHQRREQLIKHTGGEQRISLE